MKVIYGKTLCEDAVENYLLAQYPFQASARKEVMQEYTRLISTYLAPTDWKNPVGIDDLSNKKVANDRRFFISNIFTFGESTKIGPIAKEAFLLLPDPRYRSISFENSNLPIFSFVHYMNFSNYQYFFCMNHRIYASLKKTIFEGQDVDIVLKDMQKEGYRAIANSTDESGLTTTLVQKNGNYFYLKIMGNELYQFSFNPSFVRDGEKRLSIDLSK